MNMELFFNLLNILFAFGANNWLSAGISIVVFLYNLFLKLRKRKILAFLKEKQKENNTAANRTSNIFKIKFIVYTLISMFALCMAVLHFFDDMEYTERFKIYNKEETHDNYYIMNQFLVVIYAFLFLQYFGPFPVLHIFYDFFAKFHT